MFAAALIVFREVLEAALVVTIVMAATRGVPHRGRWVSLGILGGVAGAAIVAAMADILASLSEGAGQDIVNASILFLAVLLISWHVVWMNSHGRKMAADMRAVGRSVANGEKHMSILAIVVGLAVLREGSEVVLMLQGLWSTGSASDVFGGAALGLAGGALTAVLMYAGFIALPVAQLFNMTNGILVLIAAGMAAHGANFLTQAGLLPSFGGRIWDTSHILSDQSILGQLLAALVGYIDRPNGIEVLSYAATLAIVSGLMLWTRHKALYTTFVLTALLAAGILLAPQARAEDGTAGFRGRVFVPVAQSITTR